MKNKLKTFFLFINVSLISFIVVNIVPRPVVIKTSELVYLGSNGRLIYSNFSNEGENQKINHVPDFSYAGYEKGGVAIPNISTKITLTPVNGDNQPQIQQAINQLASYDLDSNGFRGAILLKEGYYEVNSPLIINASGIILRGEGQGKDGTILNATAEYKHTFLNIQGFGSGFNENESTAVNITSSYVPTGSNSFEVTSAENYTIGDEILVWRTPNDAWIDKIDTRNIGWTTERFTCAYERKITNITGTRITIDIPIVDPIQDRFGGGYIVKANVTGRISHCGIENMRLVSQYKNSTDEDHGWRAIEFIRTVNSWVRKVTALYFGRSFILIDGESKFNTVEDCAMLDPIAITRGSRKYAFNVDEATCNLFQRCYSRGDRHAFVLSSEAPGPNVWLDCINTMTKEDIGPHGKWATGALFDCIKGGQMGAFKHWAGGQGWAGAQMMYWNCKLYKDSLRLESPPGAINWAIGCRGPFIWGNGYREHWQAHVIPRSLYIQQLQDRLGEDAVNNITIRAQRDGYIWDALYAWAGAGDLTEYIT
ncbi:MAG: hypothetical protein ACTSVI_03680 [Promethearchaeota archaeon]